MSGQRAVRDTYVELAQRAWASNRARAAELLAMVEEWRATGTLTMMQRERLGLVAHSLKGSSGMFGHDRVALAAEELEAMVTDGTPELGAVTAVLARISDGLAGPPDVGVLSDE